VQLLIGEVPERKVFSERVYTKALEPYFELTQAVRVGSLANFNQVGSYCTTLHYTVLYYYTTHR
jgi:26S proteasome regulatory subunit N3